MVAYSFMQRFVPAIIAGLEPGPWMPGMKRQTIRGPRVRHARRGDELQLYTGMRTRHCRLLGRAICRAVQPIEISVGPDFLRVTLGGVELEDLQVDGLARADGFAGARVFRAFWDKQRPHEHDIETTIGYCLIEWEPRDAILDI